MALFEINKGTNVNTNVNVNSKLTDAQRRVDFRNMIYIGDGMTDVPCMKLVKESGGQSIAVYRRRNKNTATKLLLENRVNFITEANYTENSELDRTVKTIIDKISVVHSLYEVNKKHRRSIQA